MKHLSNIDLNQNQLLNGVVQNLATAPSSPVKGQIYFNTSSNRLLVYNGVDWVGADALDAMLTGATIVTAINGSASIIDLDNLPSGVATAVSQSHSATHTISQVTGLQTALDGKVDDSQVLTNVPAGAIFTDTVTTINGKTGAIAKADIVALGIPASDTNTTYSNATTTVAGLMSTTDKVKLDGVATGANNYSLPIATASVLGGVKSGTDITVDASGNVSVADNSHNHTSANISDATNANTANMIVKRDASGNFSAGTITASLSGNATTATTATTTTGNAGTASKLATARTISLAGDLGGSVSFDGSANVTLTATISDDSHNHIISNIDGLQSALDAKLDDSQLGVANGVASLDSNGLVPSSQLPSYVDDIIESVDFASLPVTGEVGKIYVDLATNLTYRWSGTAYVEISKSIALGTTAGTAYAGDAGATLASTLSGHTSNTSNPHGVTKAQVGLGSVDNTADSAKNVLSATKLATARTISLSGDASGSVSFNGTANADIVVTVANDSHTHTMATISDVSATGAELSKLAGLATTKTELGYVSGVTSSIQTQLNARTRKYATSIGDGTATSIVVTHNLNSQDLVVTLREVATPYSMVITDVEFTSANTITVKFASAPTTGQYRVTVVG